MKALVYVEIDLNYCSLTYGTAPCTASTTGSAATGTIKCFNTQKTCQDIENFTDDPITMRFALPTAYLPKDIEAIPALKGVSVTPSTISLGADLGQRATIECIFEDFRHSDTGEGFDKYHAERPYNPYTQGTFWGKFRSRQPYLQGRSLRLVRGFVGQAIDEMQIEHFVIEKFNGPTPDGLFTIVAKDVLKLADDDRSQAPRLSNGALENSLTAGAASLTLTPAGIGEEYSGDGYVAIGGREIVFYRRNGGNDAKAVLLLRGTGSGGSTTIADDSASAKTTQFNNGATVSTTVIFLSNSILFDGVDDYFYYDAEEDFELGSLDFTIDFRIRAVGTASRVTILDFGPLQDSAYEQPEFINYMAIVRNADDTLSVEVDGEEFLTTTTTIPTGSTPHIAIARKHNYTRLFVNGTQEDAAYDPNYYGVGADRPIFGASGHSLDEFWSGRLDEIRISKGVSRWSFDFTPPAAAYDLSGQDTLTITRAQFNTTAVAHNEDDRVQECLYYTGYDPAYILMSLLNNYANIPSRYLPAETWANEVAIYLAQVYTTCVPDPVGVRTLVSEIVEQAALAIWWDNINQVIRLQVIREVDAGATIVNNNNRLEGTFSVTEQPDKRISQVWTYFGLINPLEDLDNPVNFRNAVATVDLELETFYGAPAIKKIYSRWIAALGSTIATALNDLIISRFKVPPRVMSFELMRNAGVVPELGQGLLVESPFLQDATGAAEQVPVQIVRLNPSSDKYLIECEEILGGVEAGDQANRIITIDTLSQYYNLKNAHDSIYPEVVDPYGISITFIIDSSAVIYSSNQDLPAVDVGDWPVGTDISVIVRGYIYGAGGDADGSSLATKKYGGPAFYTRTPINLTIESGGRVWGGGGGGGRTKFVGDGAGYIPSNNCTSYAAGGGGAGYVPGVKGNSVNGTGLTTTNQNAANGTTSSGGQRAILNVTQIVAVIRGGNGGGPGASGSAGTDTCPGDTFYLSGDEHNVSRTSGGAGGAAIDGYSYIGTYVDNGDRRGGLIN